MNNDKTERTRVDLLKFCRKAYLSYPDGSQERKKFLANFLQNEMQMVQSDSSYALIKFLMEEKRSMFWDSLKNFALWFSAGIVFYSLFVVLLHLHYFLTACIFVGAGSGRFITSLEHVMKYLHFHKKLKNIKKYSDNIQTHLHQISNVIKRLEGPRGR